MRRTEPDTCGKLSEAPVRPLSRSVPVGSTVMVSSRGPPAALAGHWPAPVFGTQRRTSASLSRFGLLLARAVSRSLRVFDGFAPFFPWRSASVTRVAGPQVGAVADDGGGWRPSCRALAESLTPVSGWGVQPGTSLWKTQMDPPDVQTPSGVASMSHAGSPSWQSTPTLPLFACTPALVTCHSA